MFEPGFGQLIAEVSADKLEEILKAVPEAQVVGEVTATGTFTYGNMTITMEEALSAWTQTLEKVFPYPCNTGKRCLRYTCLHSRKCSCMQE